MRASRYLSLGRVVRGRNPGGMVVGGGMGPTGGA